MRYSVLGATSLALLMLLLVLGAAFIFLFQGQRTLIARHDQALAESRAAVLNAEATQTAVMEALATVEYDTLLLEGQLVRSQQEIDELTAQLAAANESVVQLEQQQAAILSNPPQIVILAPEENAPLFAGQPVDVVVVASDAVGVTSLTVMVNDEPIGAYPLASLPLVAIRESWTPPQAGRYVLEVEADNGRNRLTISRTLTIAAPISGQTITLEMTD